MASNAGFTTYEQVGIKEDISDVITNISPTQTPFSTMIGSEGVHNTLFQWQEDSLNAVGVNAQAEGGVAIAAVQNPTVLRNNVTQILEKTASTSGTADTVSTYGRDREMAYQLMLRSKEIKRDLEYAFVGLNQAKVSGDDGTSYAGTPRKTASAFAQLDAGGVYNIDVGSGSPNQGLGTSPSTFKTGGTAGAITETAVLTVQNVLYDQGAEVDTIMTPPGVAQGIALFAANASAAGLAPARTRFVDEGTKKLVNVVDVYESTFGTLRVVMNRFILPTGVLMFESAMWKKAVLRNWFRTTLAKVGDSTQVMIIGEFGLRHKNYKASGAITNVAGTGSTVGTD